MRLGLAEKGIHLSPGLDEGITPAGNVPALWRLRDDWVTGILLPSLAAVIGNDDALSLSTWNIGKRPIGGQLSDRGVERYESSILFTSKIVRLS